MNDDAIGLDGIITPGAPRELLAVKEIATALLRAERPVDVYQFALDRITPILGAAFSVVMQLSEDEKLLRPVAQHDWPAKQRSWIGALRVRVGDGPSGLAVAERRVVEVADLFADPTLTAWYEVAEELGFRSILAAPLIGTRRVLGAVVFYFTDATSVSGEGQALVRLVADQLAATAEKAQTMDALRRANGALAEANAELERQSADAQAARDAQMLFLETLTSHLADGLSQAAIAGSGGEDALSAAQAIATAARELVLCERGAIGMIESEIDARVPLQDAVQAWRSRVRTLPISVGEPTVHLPSMRTDGAWLQRLLELLIGYAASECDTEGAVVHADVEVGRGFVAHRVSWRCGDTPRQRHPLMTALDLPLARAIAVRLGGELRLESADDDGSRAVTVVFPVEGGE